MLFLHLFLFCFYISDYPGVYVGQNIAMGHTSFRVAISQWYFSEVDMYTYGGAYVHGMGHYYQVLTSKDILELSGTGVPPPPTPPPPPSPPPHISYRSSSLSHIRIISKAPPNG